MSTNNRQNAVLEIGGRLEHGPSELLVQSAFKQELEDQAPLFAYIGWADLAHTLMMMEAGVVPTEPGRELLAALLKLQERPAGFVLDPALGDLYTNREAWLLEQTPAAFWLGAGRARREATTTAFLLKLREGLLKLALALAETGQVLTHKASEFSSALMPDYTYLLTAQPTSLGHYLLGFVYPLLRDLERLKALYGRVNLSPSGCGSSNGSCLPQDRQRLAELLGFDGLAIHARDAMWQADLPIETSAVLTTILVNLDRLAEDLQIFSTEEFGLVELDDRHARASKIMPQKKNPFALTSIRGLANRMIGNMTASAITARTPSGQPDNRLMLYGTVPKAVEDTQNAVALMGEIIDYLRFNATQGQALLQDRSALATDLAEVLVLECGLDFRSAHRLVGRLARQKLGHGGLSQLTPEALTDAAEQILGRGLDIGAEVLREALNPEAALAARNTPGGAGTLAMEAMLGECRQGLQEAKTWAEQCIASLQKAEERLFHWIRAD